MLVQVGKNGRGYTGYMGTKYLGEAKKSTRLMSKYVLREETKKEKIIIRQLK